LRPFITTAGATVAISFVSGITGLIQSRAIGPYQRGLLATAVIWPSVIFVLVAYGAPHVATYFTAREPAQRGTYVSTTLALFGVIALVVSGAGVAGTALIGGPAKDALDVSFLTLPVAALVAVGIGAVLGLEDYRGWGRLRLWGPVVTFAGVIAAISLSRRTALAIVLVIAASNLVQLAIVQRALRRRGLLGRPARHVVRPILAYAWRNAANVGWIVSYQLDQLLLSIAVSPAQLGLYAVAASFGALIVPMAASSGYVMLARVATRGAGEARRSLEDSLLWATVVAGGACLTLFLAASPVVRLLFGARFEGCVTSLRILMPGVVALTLSSVFSDTLRGLGRPLVAARAEAVGAVLTVVMLPPLIPLLGISGAALASSITYVAVAATMVHGLRRVLREERARPRARARARPPGTLR
jgi:O-antigen/teichoic acid export membrane protein